jgi:hypothetical protein
VRIKSKKQKRNVPNNLQFGQKKLCKFGSKEEIGLVFCIFFVLGQTGA